MKKLKSTYNFLAGLALSLLLLGGIPNVANAQQNDNVFEDESYNSSFSGPLIYCTRSDTATAKSADGETMPVLCDDSGNIRVTGALTATLSAVDNAVLDTIDAVLDTIKLDTADIKTAVEGTLTVGTHAVTATNLDVQSGGADLATAAAQLADGHNVTVDNVSIVVTATNLDVQSGGADLATAAAQLADGHNVTVDNASIAVTATNLDVQIGGSDVVTVDLAGNNDVVLTAGLLHADSPTTEVAVLLMIDGSADTDIVTTNLSKSSAITVTGSGRITKLCIVVEGTSPFSEDGTIYFFDADPVINSNTADMTVAEAITVTSMVSLKGADYNNNFATIKINCQATDESFHAITHVVYEQEGSTTIANQDFQLHVWYRRDS